VDTLSQARTYDPSPHRLLRDFSRKICELVFKKTGAISIRQKFYDVVKNQVFHVVQCLGSPRSDIHYLLP